MSSSQSRMLARRFSEELWGAGEIQAAEEIFAPDVVNHSLQPGQAQGVRGFVEEVLAFRSAFPDLAIETGDIVAEGDLVAVRWRATGTHTGELMGIPPSGRAVAITGIDLFRVDRGRIVERWGEFDALGLMRQIGVLSSEEPAVVTAG